MSGGNINSSKCFYYALHPKLNCKTNTISHNNIQLPAPILMHNQELNQYQPIPQIPPSIAKRTLGVLLSPDGSGKTQINHSLRKTQEFYGKFTNTFLSQRAKWLALNLSLNHPSCTPLSYIFL